MLYHLLLYLSTRFEFLHFLAIIEFRTFRAFCAFFITLLLVLFFQPRFIEWFKRHRLAQPIRNDGPQSHLGKSGTPTMGGVVLVLSVAISTVLFADVYNPNVIAVVGLMLSYGLLGFIDDYKKVRINRSDGVKASTKIIWQVTLAAAFLVYLMIQAPGFSPTIGIPFLKNYELHLGYLFLPFAALVIVGCSNAVNLTDGLDGLVIGPIMTVSFAYGVFAYVAGNSKYASYLLIPPVTGAGDLAIFASAIIAGGLGFLWFNTFPAQIFMGDVGALALGGAIGLMSVITKQELVLVIAGGVFVLEALSVIVQVTSFKIYGKRIFRMAPLHHHFELKGLEEPKIIVRAWIISIVLALLSIATLKLR